MKISALIVKLQEIQSEHGDLLVCVDEYVGGDYELREVTASIYDETCVLNDETCVRPVVLIQGGQAI